MYIALDIGGTTTRVATCSSLDHIIIEGKKVFKNTANFFLDFTTLVKTIDELTNKKVDGISIGIAGQIDAASHMLLDAPNLPDWNHKPLVANLKEKYACPVFIQNDSITGSHGEAVFGMYNVQDFIYLIWGTGIGGAHISIENSTVKASQLLPWSEYFFDWEKDCGGKSIMKRFGKRPNDLPDEEWINIENLFIRHLRNLFKKQSTSLVVITGGVALNNTHRINEINKLKEYPIPLIVSHLGEDANLLGAFFLLQKNLQS